MSIFEICIIVLLMPFIIVTAFVTVFIIIMSFLVPWFILIDGLFNTNLLGTLFDNF